MSAKLLINPAKRRKARRKAPSAKQRANWARFAAMARAKSRGRSARRSGGSKRRRNPIARRAGRAVTRAYRRITRRRRNPIAVGSLLSLRSYIAPIKDAAIQGVGAVAMDVGYAYINRMLPVSMQRVPGSIGVGDAIKAFVTLVIGRLLSPVTRGLSQRAAVGALTVQAYNVTASLLPASMPVAGRLGFITPGKVVPGNGRVSANQRVGQYVGGPSPLLSGGSRVGQYVGGPSPLLSRSPAR